MYQKPYKLKDAGYGGDFLSLLEFQNVSFYDDGRAILNNISVRIENGDFISIIGPSGSGKSTFLKLCSHLISPSHGTILFCGKNINDCPPTELRKEIAYCFQAAYLFGQTVKENIYFPFSIRSEVPDPDKISELFSMFHMSEEFLDKEVKNLSGGEKQRLALIRSLVYRPQILLLDEATSALDNENAKIVENVIASLNKDGITVLWVTHSIEQAKRHANKVLNIEAGSIKSLEALK